MMKNLVSLIRQVIDGYMESFETAIPGLVSKVNDDGTVDVTPSIRNCLSNMQLQNGGGNIDAVPGVPVLFPGTASTLVKFEIREGDPVLLIASSRDLGAWAADSWENAPFNPLSFDGNDLNDLVAIPVRRLSHGGSPTTTVSISADGSVNVNASGTVNVNAKKVEFEASEATFSGDLSVDGAIKAGGAIQADGDVQANASVKPVSLATHVHTSATPGSPTTPPV